MTDVEWAALTPQKRAAITSRVNAEKRGGPIRRKQSQGKPKVDRRPNSNGQAIIRIGRQARDLLEDPSSVKDWDDEEIRRGQRRNKLGRFAGPKPKVVPNEVYQEFVRRTLKRSQEELQKHLPMVIDELIAIAQNPAAEDRDRLKAMEMVMNRVLGKEPLKVDMNVETPPWQMAMSVSIVDGADDEGDEEVPVGDGDDDDIVFE
jgi:hypothetical protein